MIRQAAILGVAVVAAIGAAQLATAVSASQANGGAAAAGAAAAQPTTVSPSVTPTPPGSAELTKSPDGHFWAEAEVDGRWVRFLVDTGASTVALTQTDARRLGLDMDSLRYDSPVMTANGRTEAAAVVLNHVSVAGARIDAVPALVVREGGLPASLLGMTYLGRLSRFEATPSSLILRP